MGGGAWGAGELGMKLTKNEKERSSVKHIKRT